MPMQQIILISTERMPDNNSWSKMICSYEAVYRYEYFGRHYRLELCRYKLCLYLAPFIRPSRLYSTSEVHGIRGQWDCEFMVTRNGYVMWKQCMKMDQWKVGNFVCVNRS